MLGRNVNTCSSPEGTIYYPRMQVRDFTVDVSCPLIDVHNNSTINLYSALRRGGVLTTHITIIFNNTLRGWGISAKIDIYS